MRAILIALLLTVDVRAGVVIIPGAPSKPTPQPVVQSAPVEPVYSGYPVSGNPRRYTHPNPLVEHLIGSPHYFDRAYVESLTKAQQEELHSDHHDEMRGRGVVEPHAVRQRSRTTVRSQSACPGGVCPAGRATIFGRLFGR